MCPPRIGVSDPVPGRRGGGVAIKSRAGVADLVGRQVCLELAHSVVEAGVRSHPDDALLEVGHLRRRPEETDRSEVFARVELRAFALVPVQERGLVVRMPWVEPR